MFIIKKNVIKEKHIIKIENFSFKNPFKNYFDSFTNRRHKKHKKNIFRPFYNTLKNNKSLSIVQNCVQKCQNFHPFSRVFFFTSIGVTL